LGALINGVFLLALCFTIFLESIERFANPEPITNPVMVLITGGAGLFANLLGLLLFHGKPNIYPYSPF
jgi:zinc transporter 1